MAYNLRQAAGTERTPMTETTVEAQAERVRQIQERWVEHEGYTGGPDRRKADSKMLMWCHDCSVWQDEPHDEDCSQLAVRDLLSALATAREAGARQGREQTTEKCSVCNRSGVADSQGSAPVAANWFSWAERKSEVVKP